VLADFNGDGKPDAAVVNHGDPSNPTDFGSVSILIGKGDGSFQAPVNYTFGQQTPVWIAAGDLHGGGKPDLAVVTNAITFNGPTAGSVAILLNNGNGTFRTLSTTALGSGGSAPAAVGIADLNGDGKPDLAVLVNQESSSNPSAVQTLLGNGDGSFRTGPATTGVPYDFSLQLSDINGDGFPDVIVGSGADAAYLLNNGDGSFQSWQHILGGAESIVDFNRDGQPDLAGRVPGGIALEGNQFPTAGVTPAAVTLGPSQSQQFSPQIFFHSSPAVTWSISPQVGSITASGLYVAPTSVATQQTVSVIATNGTNPNIGGRASITLTPSAAPAGPSPAGIVPGAGSSAGQTFTFTFSDSGGWQNLTVVDVLINSALDGRQACYVAFVPSGANSGSVYLVDNAGDAGGPYSGMLLPGSGTVSNSQCSISGAGSSVAASGNALTLTLAITFTGSFTGNKVFYLSAQDKTPGNSGWQALGTWNVPGSVPAGPWVSGMSPATSNSLGPTTYTFTFTDTNGWQDIAVANVLINSAIDGRHACFLAFVPSGASGGSVLLVDDAGDAGGPYSGLGLPGSGAASNSQCTISGAGSSVSGAGNTLTLKLAITFTAGFAGNQVFYLAARSNTLNSGWQAAGTVELP